MEGDFRGAVRIACSDDIIADMSDTTLAALKQKHPAPHPDSDIPSLLEAHSHLTVSEEEVALAIRSFPNGSAGGPDGLRPQHLKDMIGASAEVGGTALLSSLTALTNHIIRGNCPASIRPSFFGATLIALEKDGGIRPIAVGCTLRRLSAKAAGRHISDTMGILLTPCQLGVGTPYGTEAAIHAAHLYLQNLETNQVILKLDFKNAFNNIRRDRMLKAVMQLEPDLFPLVHLAYSSPSVLFWGDRLLQSAEGMQQGDPLGPLLFCLTIHHLVLQMRSEFCAWYLDDGTLGGSPDDVLDDLQVVEERAAELGLCLNRQKSEVICRDPSTLSVILFRVPDLMVTSPDKATLLGASLGDVNSISEAILEKTRKLRIMGDRLQHLQAHDAFLLRHSIAIPRLLYTLRTSPCFLSPELSEYDSVLRSIASNLFNIHFQNNDPA